MRSICMVFLPAQRARAVSLLYRHCSDSLDYSLLFPCSYKPGTGDVRHFARQNGIGPASIASVLDPRPFGPVEAKCARIQTRRHQDDLPDLMLVCRPLQEIIEKARADGNRDAIIARTMCNSPIALWTR